MPQPEPVSPPAGADEPTAAPGQAMLRRRRPTGALSLSTQAADAGPPVDLVPTAAASSAEPATGAQRAPATPLEGAARNRERTREREALERVLALAKPRTRQARATPAVLPPSSYEGGDEGSDESGAVEDEE
jgi:hypothetical protein